MMNKDVYIAYKHAENSLAHTSTTMQGVSSGKLSELLYVGIIRLPYIRPEARATNWPASRILYV